MGCVDFANQKTSKYWLLALNLVACWPRRWPDSVIVQTPEDDSDKKTMPINIYDTAFLRDDCLGLSQAHSEALKNPSLAELDDLLKALRV